MIVLADAEAVTRLRVKDAEFPQSRRAEVSRACTGTAPDLRFTVGGALDPTHPDAHTEDSHRDRTTLELPAPGVAEVNHSQWQNHMRLENRC